jgi:hypothetical protein
MTVESTQNIKVASGNDTATTFPFPMIIADDTEIAVIKLDTSGNETVLAKGTGAANYSVSVSKYPGAGSIVYPATGSTRLATGEKVYMRRVRALTQLTDLTNQGGYFADTQEQTLDKLAMVDLQQQDQIDRSLQLPFSSSMSAKLPPPVAGKIVAVNADATGFEYVSQAAQGVQGDKGDKGDKGDTGASGAGTGDMLAAQNLADLANKGTARTNLGVAIGTNVQAYSAKLDVLAAITYAANKIVKWTGTGAAVLIDFLNENDFASNSTTAVPTQASVKAYVDAAIAAGAGFNTGAGLLTLNDVAPAGWVLFNDGTLGDASSGATTRANADCSALFQLLWNKTVNADCAVSTGRGANAAADFAAHKTIALPKVLGRALCIAGAGASLTSRNLGKIVGEETHTMTLGELVAHSHGVNDPTHAHSTVGDSGIEGSGFSGGNNTTTVNTGSSATGITIQSTGSTTPFNIMQPSAFAFFVIVKL